MSCLSNVGDLEGAAFAKCSAYALCNRSRLSRCLHQKCFRRRNAGCLCNIGGVGNEEGVRGRRREFAHNAYEGERHGMIGSVLATLQAQIDRVAGLQLKIGDRFVGNQNPVRCRLEFRQGGLGIIAGKISVGNRCHLADRVRVYAIEVLQIRAHIGETMLHGFGPCDARRNGYSGKLGRGWIEGRARDRNIGAVGQCRIDAGLPLEGRIEDGGRGGEGKGESNQNHSPGNPQSFTAHRSGNNAGKILCYRRENRPQNALSIRHERCPQPHKQEREADPQKTRGNIGFVVDRGGGHAFGRGHNLIACHGRLPKYDQGDGEEHHVKPQALPCRHNRIVLAGGCEVLHRRPPQSGRGRNEED